MPTAAPTTPTETPAPTRTEPAPSGGGLHFMIRALAYKNYRLFFSGQSISLIGSWMTRIATSWLIYRLTGSALLLGVVGFCGQIPTFLLAPFAGVMVDRWDRHRLLVVTQTAAMVQSFALAALALSGRITVGHVLVLSAVQGIINAFDMPGRQAFVVEMVERKEDLGNAIALNSSMVNAARLLGPSIGGIIIAWVGEGWCFMIDAISYLAVIASLLMMTITPKPHAVKRTDTVNQMREGFAYAFGSAPIRTVLLLLALVSLVGVPYSVLMPVFATQILHGGPHTLGFLMAATGVGALIGALFLAARKSVRGLGRLIPVSAFAFGAGLVAFALSHALWLSLLLLLVTGFGFMVQMASSNTLIQTIVEDDKRGRVMSFYAMAFMGTAPFGSLLAGGLAARITAPNTLLLGGACCMLGALWFATQLATLREHIHPLYVKLGIIPEVATGIASATELVRAAQD